MLSAAATSVAGDRNAVRVSRRSTSAAPPVPPTVQPKDVALPSFVTSNADFYRIDTALCVPQLSRADWQLKIHGMVDREITYRFDDLDRVRGRREGGDADLRVQSRRRRPDRQRGVDRATACEICWREAGIHPDADMVLSMSIDGFTAGTPVEALTDEPRCRCWRSG